jgi:integrase/recombinase XerD
LKTLLAYLGANDLSHIEVYQRASMVAVKKRRHRMIHYLIDAEMKAILAAAEKANSRHQLLLALLYNTGGRVQEICDLQFKDIVFGSLPSVYLTGKGNKRRQVPIWPATAKILESELASRTSDKNLEGHVILNERDRAMTRFGALYVVKSLAVLASEVCPSIKRKRITPHILRHTTAMHLLQSGVDLSLIKMWLGHVNLNTTHAYVEFDIEMKRKALLRSKKLGSKAELKKVLHKHENVITWLESL